MERPKVLILEGNSETKYDFYHCLAEVAELTFDNREGGYTEDLLTELIRPYDAIMITSQHPITARVIDASKKLKVIAKRGAIPYENVDIEAATRKGIWVTWAPGVNYVTVAEHTVMLMLCLAKKTISLMERLKKGAWRTQDAGLQELHGKTVGIIGFGGIGQAVASILKAFKMKILVYDPYVDRERVENSGAKSVTLDMLLKESDYVTLHAPLTKETYHLIGEKEFSMMKKTAYLINTARGGLVDEFALVQALREGRIAGAGLDVFEREPPERDNPLFALPNVVVTPHMAGWTEEAIYREQKVAAMEIKRVLEGKRPRYPVNPEVGERRQG